MELMTILLIVDVSNIRKGINKMYPELIQPSDWTHRALIVLKPGLVLYGFCGGKFGRDSYGDKKICVVEVVDDYSVGIGLKLTVIDNGMYDTIFLIGEEDVRELIESSNAGYLHNIEEENRTDDGI